MLIGALAACIILVHLAGALGLVYGLAVLYQRMRAALTRMRGQPQQQVRLYPALLRAVGGAELSLAAPCSMAGLGRPP